MSTIVTRSVSRKRRADDTFAASLPKRLVPVTCVICAENDACISVARCQHKNYCISCFFKQELWRYKCTKCQRCSIDCWSHYSDCEEASIARISDIRWNENKSHDLAKNIDQYLSVVEQSGSQDVQLVITTLCSFFIDLSKNNLFPFISIDECERLLLKFNKMQLRHVIEGYKMKNVLVSFCRYPWSVSVEIGSHGVCYHGNLGLVSNINEAARCLENNLDFIFGRQGYY